MAPATRLFCVLKRALLTRFLYKLKGWESDGVLYEAGDEIVLNGDVTLTAARDLCVGAEIRSACAPG